MKKVPSGSVVKSPHPMQEIKETVGLILGWEDLLKEGMATHSNILAGRISWTEETVRLHSP